MTENPPRALACGYICKSQIRLFVSCKSGLGGSGEGWGGWVWVVTSDDRPLVGGWREEGGGIICLCGVCFHPAGERHV